MALRRPDPEVGQDLLDDLGLFDECDDPHSSGTPGTHERIHLVDLLDQPCPRALRGRGGDLGKLECTTKQNPLECTVS